MITDFGQMGEDGSAAAISTQNCVSGVHVAGPCQRVEFDHQDVGIGAASTTALAALVTVCGRGRGGGGKGHNFAREPHWNHHNHRRGSCVEVLAHTSIPIALLASYT